MCERENYQDCLEVYRFGKYILNHDNWSYLCDFSVSNHFHHCCCVL